MSFKPFKYTVAQIRAACVLRSKVMMVQGKSARKLQIDIFPLLAFFMNVGPKILFFLWYFVSSYHMMEYNCNLSVAF